MEDTKCDNSCVNCTFACSLCGKKLIPITYEELRKMGYIICEDFTTIPIGDQD